MARTSALPLARTRDASGEGANTQQGDMMDENNMVRGYAARLTDCKVPAAQSQPQVQTALKALCAAAESLEQAISGIEVRFMSVLRPVPEGGIAKLPPDNQVELASLINRQASHIAEQATRLKSIHDRCEL